MLATLLGIAVSVVTALPNLIKVIENIFRDKPKSGSDKLNAVQNIIQALVPVAVAAEPKYAGAINDLTTAVTDALVTFYNAIGEFDHTDTKK